MAHEQLRVEPVVAPLTPTQSRGPLIPQGSIADVVYDNEVFTYRNSSVSIHRVPLEEWSSGGTRKILKIITKFEILGHHNPVPENEEGANIAVDRTRVISLEHFVETIHRNSVPVATQCPEPFLPGPQIIVGQPVSSTAIHAWGQPETLPPQVHLVLPHGVQPPAPPAAGAVWGQSTGWGQPPAR